jgi:hypothetical protein
MGRKQLDSSAQHCTRMWVVGGQEAPCQPNMTTLEHLLYSQDLSPHKFFLFLRLKHVLKGHKFVSAE